MIHIDLTFSSIPIILGKLPTGVTYRNQTGGTYCAVSPIEGYAIPLETVSLVPFLEKFFRTEGDYHGTGVPVSRVPALDRILSERLGDEFREVITLRMDPACLPLSHEAWLHVLYELRLNPGEEQKGVLTWPNSD